MEASRFTELSDSIHSFSASKGFLGKGYCAAESRNRWRDWSGDTAVSDRYFNVRLSLREQKELCEKWRTQGTKFVIKEIPLIALIDGDHFLCLSCNCLYSGLNENLFIQKLSDGKTIFEVLESISSVFLPSIWLGSTEESSLIDAWPETEPLFERQSSPGKKGSSMVWSCSPLNTKRNAFGQALDGLLAK